MCLHLFIFNTAYRPYCCNFLTLSVCVCLCVVWLLRLIYLCLFGCVYFSDRHIILSLACKHPERAHAHTCYLGNISHGHCNAKVLHFFFASFIFGTINKKKHKILLCKMLTILETKKTLLQNAIRMFYDAIFWFSLKNATDFIQKGYIIPFVHPHPASDN